MANKNDPWTPLESKTIPKITAAPKDPLKDMISSETYVKSLERKLNKIKGKSGTVKAGEMIRSLHEARDLHTSLYLSGNIVDSFREDFIVDTNETVISAVQRRLNPERQALNPQELVPLVYEDILAKTLEENDNSQIREMSCSEQKT